MKSRVQWLIAATLVCAVSGLYAQPREFCAGDDMCIPDTLEIDIAGSNELVLGEDFQPGLEVDAQVMTNTETAKIQGWSYAVKHDDAMLSIVADSVTTVGTIAHPDTPDAVAIPPHFDVSQAVPGGFISAIVLSFLSETELPVGSKSAIVNVKYTVDADPGADGTKIEFVSGEIGPEGSPATDINFTVDGASRVPSTVVDGVIRKGGGPAEEICDNGIDDDGDGLIDGDDPDCPGGGGCPEGSDWALYFGDAASDAAVDATGADSLAISMRNATDAFAFQFGVKNDGGTLSFDGTLGADADRLIELVITDENGDSQTPSTPNTATAGDATGATRGSAVAGFADGDFFAVDLAPGVGGPGLTVGYVSDLDGDEQKIPATGDGDPCPVNEVVVLSFGDQPQANFIRGDADGNGELNVTDAVLIINVTLGNLQERYDCEDALDANDDGKANISDAIPVLMWMFQRGDALAAPHLTCGVDGTADGISCAQESPACAQ